MTFFMLSDPDGLLADAARRALGPVMMRTEQTPSGLRLTCEYHVDLRPVALAVDMLARQGRIVALVNDQEAAP